MRAGGSTAAVSFYEEAPRRPGVEEVRLTTAPLRSAPARWDELAPRTAAGFFNGRAWHQAHADPDAAAWHGVVLGWVGGTGRPSLRTVVPVSHYDRAPARPMLDPARLFGSMLRGGRLRTPEAWGRVTLIGATAGYRTVPVCHPDDEHLWARAVQYAMPDDGTAAVLYLDGPTAGRLTRYFPRAPLILTHARTVMRIQGSTFEEHLGALQRSSRTLARREERVFADGARAIKVLPLTAALLPDLARLHPTPKEATAAERELRRYLASPLAGSAHVILCTHNGATIGYRLVFQHGDGLVAHRITLDPRRTGHFAEQPVLQSHAPVRMGLARHLQEIDFGVGGFTEKLRRGARLLPLWSLLLRPPLGWTARHTREVNRRRAGELFDAYAQDMDVDDLALLRLIAQTGMFAA
ncbi:hypothetical protein GT755_28630 [Herbidospora sp. NEAU-GS84]|uniref:GNAT family N-acetyltransferase n=1 Tax=Herbidospora solisilvae TaxID=2696284 RepID=A0A7C9JZ29_9ACTN|nr:MULTISPECIES: hypothetical protein [Herbidospora]NAS25639.1 hypothetical protein [Herbidospora solisilvae]GLX95595.1 hypothetical protein Hesp01_35450 [Herbidospora sp. NBRC 101105]